MYMWNKLDSKWISLAHFTSVSENPVNEARCPCKESRYPFRQYKRQVRESPFIKNSYFKIDKILPFSLDKIARSIGQ